MLRGEGPWLIKSALKWLRRNCVHTYTHIWECFHAKVPRPRMEPMPWQGPYPLSWQSHVFNPLRHKGPPRWYFNFWLSNKDTSISSQPKTTEMRDPSEGGRAGRQLPQMAHVNLLTLAWPNQDKTRDWVVFASDSSFLLPSNQELPE